MTNKTRPEAASADAFIAAIEDPDRRSDCTRIAGIMAEATGAPATMWGASMVGFGSYHYRYASGREGDWFLTGFAPRKSNISLYIMAGFDRFDSLMRDLGKYKTGKSCLYIKRLADIDEAVLIELIHESVAWMREQYPSKDS